MAYPFVMKVGLAAESRRMSQTSIPNRPRAYGEKEGRPYFFRNVENFPKYFGQFPTIFYTSSDAKKLQVRWNIFDLDERGGVSAVLRPEKFHYLILALGGSWAL